MYYYSFPAYPLSPHQHTHRSIPAQTHTHTSVTQPQKKYSQITNIILLTPRAPPCICIHIHEEEKGKRGGYGGKGREGVGGQ